MNEVVGQQGTARRGAAIVSRMSGVGSATHYSIEPPAATRRSTSSPSISIMVGGASRLSGP